MATVKDDTPSFDFGTDPAPVEAVAGTEYGVLGMVIVEGEPTSRRHGANALTFSPGMAASAGSEVEYTQSKWHEVPQALFLSWSDVRQRSYCAARDRDSAKHAENDEWREFYLRRADWYDEASRA